MDTIEYTISALGPNQFRTNRLRRPRREAARIGFWIALWAVSIAAATTSFWSYAQNGDLPSVRFPSDGRVAAAGAVPGQITLIVGLHPHCPCSRQISEELNRMAAESEAYQFLILVTCPSDAPSSWMDSQTIRALQQLPRTRVVRDECGSISASLGMLRSGHVVIVDAAGTARYSGGMTSNPMHTFDRPAHSAASALTTGRRPPLTTAMVFGCPLVSASDCEPPDRSAP